MYAGQVVLEGPTRSVLRAPAIPYARGLLASIPRLRDSGLPRALDGRPPGPGEAGPGCAFADRCALAIDACRAEVPPLFETDCGSRARCIRLDALDSLPAAPGPRPDDRAAVTDTGTVAPALDISGLCITYNRRNLIQRLAGAPVPVATVDGIDLQVPPGETLALVGESGSGKSTILKAIAGMLEPEEGSITVGGRASGGLRGTARPFDAAQGPDHFPEPGRQPQPPPQRGRHPCPAPASLRGARGPAARPRRQPALAGAPRRALPRPPARRSSRAARSSASPSPAPSPPIPTWCSVTR